VVIRSRAALSAFAVAVLMSGWTIGAAACDRAVVADSPGRDHAAGLKLEHFLLKHQPRLVIQKTAPDRSAH
jgi:hypothetical protein